MKKFVLLLLSAVACFAQAAADLPETVVPVGTKSVVLTVTINPGATLPLTYVWQLDGAPVLGAASSPTYTILNVPYSKAGVYTCIVSNVDGQTVSNKAPLKVIAAAPKNPPVGAVLSIQMTP